MLAATFTQVQHFECSDTIERRDGIVFDFCMRLPHTVDPHTCISSLDWICKMFGYMKQYIFNGGQFNFTKK